VTVPPPLILAPPDKIRLLADLRARKRELDSKARRAYRTPGELAQALDPSTRQTPALDLIDANLLDVAEGRCERLIICMPPQEGKSERVSRRTPLWLLARNPDLRIALASYEHGVARRWGRAIRNDIAEHPELGLTVRHDTSAAHEWQLEGHRGGMYCVGIGGALTGRPVDVLLIDDPIKDRKQADSQLYRDTVWDWWTNVARTRLAPGAPVVLILTRWHDDDLAGRLLAEPDSAWRLLNIPARADHKPELGQTDPLGRTPGEWMLSARGRTVAQWEQIRVEVGSRAFSALYQGRASPDVGNVWQRPWWRRYRTPLWSQHPTQPDAYQVSDVDELVMSWDCAFKDTKSSDYVVGQVWARRGATVYLLDQIHKRLSFTDTLTAFTALAARWPQASAKYVEDKANGTAIIDTFRSKIPGVIPVTPTESKYARANAVAPFIEAGNVLLPEAEIALFDPDELVDEAAAFPHASHDDQVDATSQALAQMLLDGTGAQAWIDYARRRAEAATAAVQQAVAPTEVDPAALDPTLRPVDARKAARDAAVRAAGHRR
jgi:predicted phage terminase large subunit-like protein